ncbi:MAG: hypothetical protein ACOYNC_10370 [Bacteroidales bacterium]
MKTLLKTLLLILLSIVICTPHLPADPPSDPPPLPGEGHGTGNNQPPAAAPIDDGLAILLVLGAAFAGTKLYHGKPGYKTGR